MLPFDRVRGRVLLIQQFRWPIFEWGYRQLLVEVIAGKLDGDAPLDCIHKEAMEEAGVTLSGPRLVSHCFVSPGAVKERVSLFLADYDSPLRRAPKAAVMNPRAKTSPCWKCRSTRRWR